MAELRLCNISRTYVKANAAILLSRFILVEGSKQRKQLVSGRLIRDARREVRVRVVSLGFGGEGAR